MIAFVVCVPDIASPSRTPGTRARWVRHAAVVAAVTHTASINASFRRGPHRLAAAVVALLAVLTVLAFGVHLGWVAGIDAAVASWFDTHRSRGVNVVAYHAFPFIGPAPVAAAGVLCGALLSWKARSTTPAIVVIGTVGAAAMAENALKDVVARAPWTAAERRYIPADLLLLGAHSFPSGHIAGVTALLGILAVCLGRVSARGVRIVLALAVLAGVVAVDLLVLYVFAHCFSDAVGGMALGALCATLGTIALGRLSAGSHQHGRENSPRNGWS
jgi:membrane-associated phospholipid phosphatase